MQSATKSFTVSVPENNALGISSVAGTYAIADGVMTLAIVTSFQNGGTYEYTATCTRQETAAQDELPPFAWQGKTVKLTLITEDEAIIAYQVGASEDPRGQDGRFVKLMFVADGDPLTADEMKSLGSQARLRNANMHRAHIVRAGFGHLILGGVGGGIDHTEELRYVHLVFGAGVDDG